MSQNEAKQVAVEALRRGWIKPPGPNWHSMGGIASAARLTPKQRSERARHAALKRWHPDRLRVERLIEAIKQTL